MKKVAIVLGVVLITSVLMAGGVGAANGPWLAGNDAIDRAYVDSRTDFYLVDTNNPFQYDCIVNNWTIYAASSSPVGFMIYRHDGGTWSVVYNGSTELKTPNTGLNTYSIGDPVQVKSGDFVGLYSGTGAGAVDFGKGDDEPWDRGNLTGKVLFTASGTGATTFSGSSDRVYSVNAAGAVILSIDIKPGSDPNSINLGGNGVVPVAILGSETFDAATVNASTVTLAGAAVKLKGKSGNSGSLEDVNGDGSLDLVVQVYTDQLAVELGDAVAVVNAYTYDGLALTGSDSIRIVPPE